MSPSVSSWPSKLTGHSPVNGWAFSAPDGSLTPRGDLVVTHTPQRRFGGPEDLIGTLLWLLCDKASGFVTGQVVPVDGGFSAFAGV